MGRYIRYNSPEYILEEEVSLKTDVWSLGTVLFELYTGIEPWKGLNSK